MNAAIRSGRSLSRAAVTSHRAAFSLTRTLRAAIMSGAAMYLLSPFLRHRAVLPGKLPEVPRRHRPILGEERAGQPGHDFGVLRHRHLFGGTPFPAFRAGDLRRVGGGAPLLPPLAAASADRLPERQADAEVCLLRVDVRVFHGASSPGT